MKYRDDGRNIYINMFHLNFYSRGLQFQRVLKDFQSEKRVYKKTNHSYMSTRF